MSWALLSAGYRPARPVGNDASIVAGVQKY